MRTLEWDQEHYRLKMIDQRVLPEKLDFLLLDDHHQVAEAIRSMAVRGAPAIGAAAAYGMALAAIRSKASSSFELCNDLAAAAQELGASRPTAVNLCWALKRMLTAADIDMAGAAEIRSRLIAEADRIAEEDVATNLAIARCGVDLIDDGDTIIHHCNTGALATVDWGTALGVIRMAHQMGKKIHVLVDETRPRLQGARLTAWELTQYGIPFDVITDGAAGYFLHRGEVNKVFFGADRVAANGDVANKIGTYMLALAAYNNNVPVYSVFPTTTVDLALPNGSLIPIEERNMGEVLDLQLAGERVMPEGSRARNPAFDVTPHYLISALVTERGIVYPPFHLELTRIMNQKG